MSSEKPEGNPGDDFPNPFGPGGPFAGGLGSDPWRDLDAWMRQMGLDPVDFRRMFDEMQKNLQEAFKHLGDDPSKSFVQGFNVRIGPDGKPSINSFGNKPHLQKEPGSGMPSVGASEREPLTDVIEDKVSVAITMELPGVEKQDIDLHVTGSRVEVSVDNARIKYHKQVRLPSKVDPQTTKATYNNGILDVTMKKLEKDDPGFKVNVE